MNNREEIMNRYFECLELSNRLTNCLGLLSNTVSDIIGEEVTADICNGGEIEFRYDDDYSAMSTIRIEEILEQYNIN